MNYQKQLDDILSDIQSAGTQNSIKPTLLLHACCAPCSSYVLEYLSGIFDITVYYYNPNIYPPAEYKRRLNELKSFLPRFTSAVQNHVQLVESGYDQNDYFAAVKTDEQPELQTEPERGERCRRCYLFRMKKAYEYAAAKKFDWFTTTLSISPFKDADKINVIGKQLEKENGPHFLTSDFKKKNGFLRSLQLSSEYGLYRQEYCGCIYSFTARKEHDEKMQ